MIEMFVVTALISLTIISVVNFKGLLGVRRVDNQKVAFLQQVVIALDEYKNECRFYPPSLTGTFPGCSKTLQDFMPDGYNFEGIGLDDVEYVKLKKRGAGNNSCYYVHVGIYLSDLSLLSGDDDFYSLDDDRYEPCGLDFDGADEDPEVGGYYDFLLEG